MWTFESFCGFLGSDGFLHPGKFAASKTFFRRVRNINYPELDWSGKLRCFKATAKNGVLGPENVVVMSGDNN